LRLTRRLKKAGKVFGAVIMGVPGVEFRNLAVGGEPSAETFFFNKERQALQHIVLHGVIRKVKDQ